MATFLCVVPLLVGLALRGSALLLCCALLWRGRGRLTARAHCERSQDRYRCQGLHPGCGSGVRVSAFVQALLTCLINQSRATGTSQAMAKNTESGPTASCSGKMSK